MSINILLIILILFAAFKVAEGYKHGMVRELVSLISLLVLCAVVALLANGISSYHDGKIFNVIVVVLLLAVLGIAHHLLGVVFFSAKLISKLPVIHFADKLLGILFGLLEAVLLLWTIYTLTMMMEMGALGQLILSLTQDSRILTWLYRNNWLAYGIEHVLSSFSFVPLSIK
jgi:uncharacterized membrane protein required for colicin V production